MSDERSSSTFLSAAAGGAVGAILASGKQMQASAEMSERFGRLEQDLQKLVEMEKARGRIAREDAQRGQAERVYQREALWLSYCNNDERFDFLLGKYGDALAGEFARLLLASAFGLPEAVRARRDYEKLFEERGRLREDAAACKRRIDDYRKQYYPVSGLVFAALCLVGGAAAATAMITEMPEGMGRIWVFLAIALSCLAPGVRRLQRPERRRRETDGPPPLPGASRATLDERIEEERQCGEKIHAGILAASQAVDSARGALRKQLDDAWPIVEAQASSHAGCLWRKLGELQQYFPPRLRCEIGSLPGGLIVERLLPGAPRRYGQSVENYLSTEK